MLGILHDSEFTKSTRIEKLFLHQEWDNVIAQHEEDPSDSIIGQYYYNLALSEKGQLCNRMFHGNQDFGENSLVLPSSLEYLDRVKNELAKPLLKKLDIPTLLTEQPAPREIAPYLFEMLIEDPIKQNMAKKLYERRYLLKKEIAPQFQRGKDRPFRGKNHEGTWHYILKDFEEEPNSAP